MNLVRLTMLGMALYVSSAAYGGGWTGSGGDLIEDAQNPWFIRHISKRAIVPYCILVDNEHFPVPLAELQDQIKNAFNHWADEFSSAFVPAAGYGKVLVATENFVYTDCSEDRYDHVPLRFQFGKLLDGQMEKFQEIGRDPKRLVGIAIRESYDRETLRGKGFIYISPESGPLKLEGENVVERPWSGSSNRLQMVLRHEIGHIFGIAHMGDHRQIMGAGFPEQVVSALVEEYQWLNPSRIFLKPQGWSTQFHCSSELTDNFTRYLGVPKGWRCLEFRVGTDSVQLLAAPDYDHTLQTIGWVNILDRDQTNLSVVKLWVPPEQKVLPVADYNGKTLTIAYASQHQLSGVFRSTNEETDRMALFDIAPGWFRFSGDLDGKIVLNLFRR